MVLPCQIFGKLCFSRLANRYERLTLGRANTFCTNSTSLLYKVVFYHSVFVTLISGLLSILQDECWLVDIVFFLFFLLGFFQVEDGKQTILSFSN